MKSMRTNRWSIAKSFKTKTGWRKLSANTGEHQKDTEILEKFVVEMAVKSKKTAASRCANKPKKYEHLQIE